MPIEQTKKQSDLEKRLKILRTQVYGRGETSAISYQLSDKHQEKSNTRQLMADNPSDLIYLRQDLLKISIFASAAVVLQLIIFTLNRNGIINLNFF